MSAMVRYYVTGYNDGKPYEVGPYPWDQASEHAEDIAGYEGVHGVECVPVLEPEPVSG